jgi:hypothetical protein
LTISAGGKRVFAHGGPDYKHLWARLVKARAIGEGAPAVAKRGVLVYKTSYFFGLEARAGSAKMDKEFTTISIPTSLYKKVEESIQGTETSSVASYIVNLLRETLSKAEAKTEVFNSEEEEKVKERLKALGYID